MQNHDESKKAVGKNSMSRGLSNEWEHWGLWENGSIQQRSGFCNIGNVNSARSPPTRISATAESD